MGWCTARGRLRPSLRPSPRPRLTPTSYTDVVSDTDTVDTDLDTLDTVESDTMAVDSDTTAMAMDSDSTARGLLMLSPRLRLILTTLVDTDTPDISDTEDSDMPDSDTATSDTDMVIDTCMARGLLMLSLRLRLILTTLVDTDTPDISDSDTATSDTDTADTSTESRLNQDLSVNQQLEPGQKWIVISLKFPSPVLQFQCYHTKSLVMVSRKQENQSGKNP